MHVEQKSCIYQSTVWIGLLLFILAGVFGGLSFVQVDLRWASILFFSLAILDLLLFVILRYKLKQSGGDTDICAFFKCKNSDSESCLSGCYCDDTEDEFNDDDNEENRRNETVQHIRENSVIRSNGRGSTRNQRPSGTVRSISQEVAQREAELRSRLRSLERHINVLFRDYSVVESRMNKLKNSESSDRRYLVTRERLQEKLTMVQDCMHREYRKLCRWFQGNDGCSFTDVEQAKERLRNVREHVKSIQRRIERIERTIDDTESQQYQERSIRRSNSRTSRGEQRRSLSENRHSLTIPDTHYTSSRRSSLEVPVPVIGRRLSSPDVLSPLPPPYQEEDPLPTMTQHYSRTSLQRQSSIRSGSSSPDSSPGVTRRPGMFRVDSFVSGASVSGVSISEGETPTMPVLVQNATTGSGALVLHLPRNVVANSLGLAIPTAGEAPPTYEEASSSQV